MIPGRYDITIYRGSTWPLSFDIKDANDVAVDIQAEYIDNPTPDAGEIRMYIRRPWIKKPGVPLPDPLLELTTSNGRITVSSTLVSLKLTPEETEALTFNKGSYDIELVTGEATPVVDKPLYGDVTVMNEKTVK